MLDSFIFALYYYYDLLTEEKLPAIFEFILVPFKLLWNLILFLIIIGAFILWFSFIFGSILPALLILIFAPQLIFLPLELAYFWITFDES